MSPQDKGRRRDETSLWEWILAAVSAVLVFGSIGFMTWEALTQPDTPPRIEIAVDSVVRAAPGWLVQLSVRNTGERTAAGLRVEGELRTPDGAERASVTIDYVPGGGTRAAGLFFTADPRAAPLRIRPAGYQQP